MRQKTHAPIRFKNREEFSSRPNYYAELRCNQDDLDYIVGKYEFSEKEFLRCGLNGCNTKHWHGFVISTKSAKETHCGKDCGEREFGIRWNELEAEFNRQDKIETQRKLVSEFIENRTQLVKEATELGRQVEAACARITTILAELDRDSFIRRAFDNAIATDGRILTEIKSDSEISAATGHKKGRANLQVAGTIKGHLAVQRYDSTRKLIMWWVIKPLQEIDESSILSMTEKKLQEAMSNLKQYHQRITEAREFLAASSQFLSPTNAQEFKKLRDVLPGRAKVNRVNRILTRLSDLLGAADD
ncbi:conserved protein of unknown function [Burkholderia multivorans]